MARTEFQRPDERAMARLLDEHMDDPTGLILRLAWRAGLTRREICALTWAQADLDALLLRLPERETPLDAETAAWLRRWRERCAALGDYVAVSPRRRGRLVPQSVSTLARLALDGGGLKGVGLRDLRLDFIRRQLAEHDWPYVLRIAGVSLTTWRGGLCALAEEAPAPPEAEPRPAADEDFALWRVMQAERTRAAGIALWLASRLGLQNEEIVRLTWDDVDLDAGRLRLPDREAALPVSVRHVLEEARALRREGDDPHVVLTPRTRKPMDAARLATVVRGALIRGGIEGKTLRDFRQDPAREAEREALLALAAERDGLTRAGAAEALGLSMGQAYARLKRLEADGALTRLNERWFPAGTVAAPEEREEAVLRYLAEHGPSPRREFEALLRLGRHRTTELLNRMTAEGKLEKLPGSWRYGAVKDYNSISESQEDG